MNEPTASDTSSTPHGEIPPTSQEEVISSAVAALLRQLRIGGRAAQRAARQEGPTGEAIRALRDAAKDAVAGRAPGGEMKS